MIAGEAHLESGCVLVPLCYFEYLLAGVLVSETDTKANSTS